MGELSWRERIDHYAEQTGFPGSLFIADDGRVVGTWIGGQDYRVKSQWHGGYPATYLRRVKGLFPDKTKTLHLFSGKVDLDIFPGVTVDLNPDLSPDYLDDAQTLLKVPLEDFDLCLADPPYTASDADHYGFTMVKRNLVMKALRRLPIGAHVVWLDMVLPMWSKDFFRLVGAIGYLRSSNHRFRMITIFERRQ